MKTATRNVKLSTDHQAKAAATVVLEWHYARAFTNVLLLHLRRPRHGPLATVELIYALNSVRTVAVTRTAHNRMTVDMEFVIPLVTLVFVCVSTLARTG